MDLYPAIDLRGGRVVQLQQGDYDRETVYGDDPVAVAERFEAAGARWIHMVDLDAARSGTPANHNAIAAVCARVSCFVQASGGVRSVAAAASLLDAGAHRVVVGTAAVEQPDVVDELVARAPDRVAVGLDARGHELATRGWTTGTGVDLLDYARRFDRPGIGALVVTSIGRDGMLKGPDTEQMTAVLGAVSVPVIASGGIATLDDVRRLATLEVGGRRLAGAISGTAIYERRFTVEEAIAACSLSA
jgi:phosphoribosylformimino-5-aminoimidazole carboxamide ribotide isomerase